VFSFADGAIRAIGVAVGRAREAPKPPEFGSAGVQWGTAPGWQVPVRFNRVIRPVRPKDHATQLAPVLPTKHSPIRKSGDRNQGVYLAAVPEPMVDKLIELLAGEVEQIVESVAQMTGGSLVDEAAEERLQQRTDIGPTVKQTLVSARRRPRSFPSKPGTDRADVPCDWGFGSPASSSQSHQTVVHLRRQGKAGWFQWTAPITPCRSPL
jgi:hypothetical protein